MSSEKMMGLAADLLQAWVALRSEIGPSPTADLGEVVARFDDVKADLMDALGFGPIVDGVKRRPRR